MEEQNVQQYEQLLKTAPGGIAKIAFDEMLSILYLTDKFYSLVKNVSEKHSLKTPISLIRMVYSADIIYLTQQLAVQRQRKDNKISLNFRTLQQDGSFKWVMVTGAKTAETYQSGNKTVPVYSCVAVDVTGLMVNYKKLEQTAEYHRVISELSRDIFFEYEIATDTLTFTELFREIFGKENSMTGFRKRLEKSKIIHAEEHPAVVAIFNSMMSGRKQARFELRLVSRDGIPSWYTCYASIIFDENRNPYKVVGKLTLKNIIEVESDATSHEPQKDALTGVCTKDSAEVLISEAASKQAADSLSALLLIEIRNYKNINEIKRSIYGENIMTMIGGILMEQFRSSDIIGRTGLNEFVAYVKAVPSDKAVYELAEKLCKSVEALHSYEHTKSGISASIGIALHRGEAEYPVLMANANTALVMAKKIPTCSFEVFSGAIG